MKVLPDKRQLYWSSQGQKGLFKFLHVPPGKFLILVNRDDMRDPLFPYPRTFYPGVRGRASAGTITVQAGEQVKGVVIRLE
jgi:hypothetical protein